MKREIENELQAIERQMEVNLEYFTGSDRITLENLQGHIKDSIGGIRAALNPEAKAREGFLSTRQLGDARRRGG